MMSFGAWASAGWVQLLVYYRLLVGDKKITTTLELLTDAELLCCVLPGDELMKCVDLYNQSQSKWFEEMVTTSLVREVSLEVSFWDTVGRVIIANKLSFSRAY